jgi:hypothetical protein
MTIATTSASRQPMAKPHQRDDRDRRQPEMEQQLVGLLVGRLAVVARDLDVDVGGNERPLQLLQIARGCARRWSTALAPARLAMARTRRRARRTAAVRRARVPRPRLVRLGDEATLATSRT